MTKHRRSLLQIEILLHLEENPTKTITELAGHINAKRPSVSRSLRSLKKQGLVYRDRSGWHLSDDGKDEANKARESFEEMSETISVAVGAIGAKLGSGIIASLPTNTFSQIAGISKQMEETARLLNRFNFNEGLAKQLSEMTSIPLIADEFYRKSLVPLVEIQERNTKLFQSHMSREISPLLEAFSNQNNMALASTIDNIVKIRLETIASINDIVPNANFGWLVDDLNAVSESFSQLFDDYSSRLEAIATAPSALNAVRDFSIPAETLSRYTYSARNLVIAEYDTNLPALPESGSHSLGDEELDPLLYELNPEFVEMRRGSWIALNDANPDRIRHAATSQRELLRQLLEYFIPNWQLPDENRQGPQIRARTSGILNATGSEGDFVDDIASAVLSFYRQLNIYTHHNRRHEDSLIAILQTGEGLIRLLLVLANRNGKDE